MRTRSVILPLRHALLMGALLALTVACAQRSSTQWNTPNMTALSPRIQPLFEKTRTVCFGRFLIDVPSTAEVVWGDTSVPLGVIVAKDAAHKLDQLVAERESERKSKKRFPLTKGINQYLETVTGPMKGQRTVIGYEGFDGRGLRIYSYYAMGPDLIQLDALPREENKARAIGTMNDMASRLRPRKDDEAPSDPGMCIENAFLSDNPKDGPSLQDLVRIGFRLKEFPDVHFSILTNPANPHATENSRLKFRLERAEKASPIAYARLKNLRRAGDRKIGEWTGIYEALTRTPDEGESISHHDFVLDHEGVPGDIFRPRADIRLSSGVGENKAGLVKPSITDEEAIALWDKITSTIRVRPTGGPAVKKTSDAGPLLPLGELAATGRACPQTGLWECVDEGDIRGGRRQLFRAGEKMPAIVRVGTPSLWQRIKGETPTYRSATVWKLVDHDLPRSA